MARTSDINRYKSDGWTELQHIWNNWAAAKQYSELANINCVYAPSIIYLQEGEVIIDQNIQVISSNKANGGRLLRVDYAVDSNIAAKLKRNSMLTIEITLREFFSSVSIIYLLVHV